nr:MAG TPA: hypothetical protein [Caudoviricetes sp.]
MSAYKLVLTLVTGEMVTIPYYNNRMEARDAARDIMVHPKYYVMQGGAGEITDVFIRNSAIVKVAVVKKGEEER